MLSAMTALLVGVIIVFNDINIQIRMREVKVFLQRSNRTDNSIDHIGLVMMYRLHRDMYENRITSEDVSMIEVRLNSILSSVESEKVIPQGKYVYATVPVVYAINFIRGIIGMPDLSDSSADAENGAIDIAYYFERSRLYHRAIEEYQGIIDAGVSDRNTASGVLLHMGYCYSILGDYENARRFYLRVIKDYGDINIAVTAAILLRYIEGFRSETERILATEKDSVNKGEKLYKLIAFRESLEVLARVEKSVSPAEKPRIKFLKGRTLEELGEVEKAVDIYQGIVMEDSSSKYAIEANRRIFVAGSITPSGGKLLQLAEKNSLMIKDSSFSKLIEENARYSPAEKTGLPEVTVSADEIQRRASSAVREKKIEMMIRQVDRRMNVKTAGKGETAVIPEKRLIKIYTTDGNIFTGTLMNDSGGTVTVRTSIGDIKIEKSRISRRIDL